MKELYPYSSHRHKASGATGMTKITETQRRKLEKDLKEFEDFFATKPKLKWRLYHDFHHYRLTVKEWIKKLMRTKP